MVRDYIDGLEIIGTDINIVATSEKIDSAECMEEYVMLGMRLSEGIVIEDFERRFNTSFVEKYGVRIDEELYDVIYRVEASNLMPEITIIEK